MTRSPTATAWGRTAWVWLATVGRPALTRAWPAWLGAGIVGGAVLGGNGLGPADLAALARAPPRVAVVIGAAWAVLLFPAVRATIDAPGAAWLRSLPGAGWLGPAAALAIAAVVHAPAGLLAVAATGAGGAAGWLALTLVTLAAAHAAARWVRVPRPPRWRSPAAALVGAHLRAIRRRRGASLAFAAGLVALVGAVAGAMLGQVDDTGGAASVVGAGGALTAACALAAVATTIVDDRRGLGPWLAAAGTAHGTARLATAAVLIGAGALVGAALGATAGWLAMTSAARGLAAVAAATVSGAAVGAALVVAVERGLRAPRPGMLVAAMAAGVGVAATFAIGLGGVRGIGAVALIGAALAVGGRPT
ncbi:MAG: hypothetical protein R3B06_15190 [Kofleriaceae bacterium]